MACGKTPYPDKRSAETARNHRMESPRGHNRPVQLSVYPCPDCRCWHLARGRQPNFPTVISRPRYSRARLNRSRPNDC